MVAHTDPGDWADERVPFYFIVEAGTTTCVFSSSCKYMYSGSPSPGTLDHGCDCAQDMYTLSPGTLHHGYVTDHKQPIHATHTAVVARSWCFAHSSRPRPIPSPDPPTLFVTNPDPPSILLSLSPDLTTKGYPDPHHSPPYTPTSITRILES